jgi:two-component system cell cycle sensor histidine kinase/response regulator CckA
MTENRRLKRTVQRFRERLLLAEKMSVLGRLAGGIVHDLRNWLFVIRAQTNLLADTGVPEVRKPVQEIQRAVDHSEDLMRNLAAFGQREPGRPLVIDLNHVVNHLERTIRSIAGNKVQVVVKTSASSAEVEVDREQIQQVLFNLINNSLDAMPKGGTLTVAVYCVELQATEVPDGRRTGSYVRLEVEDTGHGMDGTVKAKLFEPFFTTKDTGTGLGLANVREVVHDLGGFIKVWSEPSKGSRFEVFVPRISST